MEEESPTITKLLSCRSSAVGKMDERYIGRGGAIDVEQYV